MGIKPSPASQSSPPVKSPRETEKFWEAGRLPESEWTRVCTDRAMQIEGHSPWGKQARKKKLIQENAAELKSSREMRQAHLAGTKHRTQIKIAGPLTDH